MYKKASKKQLRISTLRGSLTVEQLWNLSLAELNEIAIGLDKELEQSSGKSYIKENNTEDSDDKLRRNIVVDIIETKQKDSDEYSKSLATKQRNQNILEIIEKKKQGSLEDMSVEDLEKMLAE